MNRSVCIVSIMSTSESSLAILLWYRISTEKPDMIHAARGVSLYHGSVKHAPPPTPTSTMSAHPRAAADLVLGGFCPLVWPGIQTYWNSRHLWRIPGALGRPVLYMYFLSTLTNAFLDPFLQPRGRQHGEEAIITSD